MVYGNNSSVVTEDYLSGCGIVNVVPSYASIDEMMYFVIESCDEDFNNIMMEAGITELQYFEENHEEYVYEASEGKGFIEKIKDGFKKMWEKVKGMIEEALKVINEKADKFRTSIMKKIDKKFIGDKAKNIDPKKVLVTSSYTFSGLGEGRKDFVALISAKEKDIAKYYDKAKADFKANRDSASSASSVDAFDKKISERVHMAIVDVSGVYSESMSTVVKNMKINLRGEAKDWKGSDVRNGFDKILDEVTNYPSTKRDLKKSYNDLKKSFNETMHNIDKDGKDAGLKGKEFNASLFSKAVKGYRTLKNLAIAAEQAEISVLNERYNTYRTIVLKMVGARGKVKESAMMSESSTSDAIDSLFNW